MRAFIGATNVYDNFFNGCPSFFYGAHNKKIHCPIKISIYYICLFFKIYVKI